MKNKLELKLNRFPLDPARLPLWYGWIIIFLGTLGTLMSIPGQTMGVSVFTDILIDKLGISRLNLSLTYMVGTALSSMMLTTAGKFYDRRGVRTTLLCAGILMGGVLLFLSRADLIASGLGSIIFSQQFWAFAVMILGFFLLRFSGQGVMTMASRNMVMKWFDKRRGLAAAILGVFVSFGFSYAPRVLDTLITRFSWRGAWQFLAIVCGFGFGLFAFLFYRDSPKVCGLKPDGPGEVKANPKARKLHERVREISLKEARREPVLWMFALSLGMLGLFNTAYTFHVVDLFSRIGLERTRAIAIFLPISVVSVSVQFLVSAYSDRMRLEGIYLIFLSAMGVGMGALSFLSEGIPILLLILGMGVSGGVFGTLSSVTWVRLYGNAHLGAISGFAMAWTVVGSAVGPYFFSLIEQLTGGYRMAALICLLITAGLIGGTVLLLVRARKTIK